MKLEIDILETDLKEGKFQYFSLKNINNYACNR